MFSTSSQSKRHTAASLSAGFGLVELLVSITIIMIVMSIVLARQESFNAAVLLRNQAYDIALGLREVQLSAVSAQGDGGRFREVIGVYFTSDATQVSPTNREYIVFRDSNRNGFYDTSDEVIGVSQRLDARFEIRDIRAVGDVVGDEVTLIFVRPNFDTRFFVGAGAGNELASASAIEIDIGQSRVGGIASNPNLVRTIEVTTAGQITVQ